MPSISLDDLSSVSSGSGSSKTYLRHTVLAGETLLSLSEKYGTTVQELMEINNIRSSSEVIVGHKILIPVKK